MQANFGEFDSFNFKPSDPGGKKSAKIITNSHKNYIFQMK